MNESEYLKKKMILETVSNPDKVNNNLKKYCQTNNLPLPKIYISSLKNKKYMIINPYNDKKVYFGDIKYEDYTKHNNEERKQKYLLRASKIKGEWLNNPFSSNNLSIHLLW
jgi:hypothetical protein